MERAKTIQQMQLMQNQVVNISCNLHIRVPDLKPPFALAKL